MDVSFRKHLQTVASTVSSSVHLQLLGSPTPGITSISQADDKSVQERVDIRLKLLAYCCGVTASLARCWPMTKQAWLLCINRFPLCTGGCEKAACKHQKRCIAALCNLILNLVAYRELQDEMLLRDAQMKTASYRFIVHKKVNYTVSLNHSSVGVRGGGAAGMIISHTDGRIPRLNRHVLPQTCRCVTLKSTDVNRMIWLYSIHRLFTSCWFISLKPVTHVRIYRCCVVQIDPQTDLHLCFHAARWLKTTQQTRAQIISAF